MPKRTDIESILIIGAGPIVIGQACEFDYSGAQACKALKDEGYRIVLVNSNPATIMTDPELADATYIEPITPEMVEKIIARERPDALLPTMGGQTALNTAMALARSGVLERYGVELIGANETAIAKAEDRQLFRQAMDRIGLASPKSRLVRSLDEAHEALAEVGLPAIIRPSFTLGGTGGGIAYNRRSSRRSSAAGCAPRRPHEVLIEESVLGWKEYEMEVVRDRADNCIIVCSIENIDPMGVHTGDSVCVAPALTLTDKEYQLMRNASIAVLARDRRRYRRVERAVRGQPDRRTARRHRDEPAGVALLGAGLEGDRLPDRQGRGQARRRLHARRARERDHRRHPGLVRADDRLHRHQDAALHLREVPGGRAAADDLDEIGRRGDGDRPQLCRIGAEGAALDGDRASPASTRSRSRESRAPARRRSRRRSPSRRPTGCC